MRSYGGIILNELPQENVVRVLCEYLIRLSKLYQIKDFTTENAVILSSWILTNYRYEQLETITKVLESPPGVSTERVWRLTPDVIQSWLLAAIDKLSAEKEKEIHNARFQEVEGEPDDERLTAWLESLEGKEGVRPITEEEVNKEGQDKPYKPSYTPPGREYKIMMDLKIKYGQECTDLHTGRIKPGMPSFEEWLLLQK